jgi:hypothetical protein
VINTENDRVLVYEAEDGWRWHRIDTKNGLVVSEGGQGYENQAYCLEAAGAYNPGIKPEVIE